jgi:hypothetical protein
VTGRARTLVTLKLATRLVQLLSVFGSNFDGEVTNAARAAHALIKSMGLTWSDVIVAPAADWQFMAFHVRAHRHALSPREADFIDNIARLRRQPTDRQLAWLEAIFERVSREAA